MGCRGCGVDSAVSSESTLVVILVAIRVFEEILRFFVFGFRLRGLQMEKNVVLTYIDIANVDSTGHFCGIGWVLGGEGWTGCGAGR